MADKMTNDQKLIAEIVSRKEDLIQLTQDLIKIPTVNPPCSNYLEICEYLDNRLKSSGFQTQMIRAKGAIADSDKNPRWNIIGRYEGKNTGDCVHFNSHTDVVEVGHVISTLQQGQTLAQKYIDHALTGNWLNYRDCHVKPDLVLIYKIENGILKLANMKN